LKTTVDKENTFNLSGIYHIKKKVMGYNGRKLKVAILLDVSKRTGFIYLRHTILERGH
jgi:hypothetical protein